MGRFFLVCFSFACSIFWAPAYAAATINEINSGASERESTAITVYNDDLALIKERRHLALPVGVTRLSLREVSAKLRPETALLRTLSGHPISLLEQNFDFDLLTPASLLEKYVGREVGVIRAHPVTGEERRETATVLSNQGGIVLRFADRIETGTPGRIVFDQLPANLRERPTLSVLLDGKGGEQLFELSYLSGGFSWQADYVANLESDGKQLDLSGWVTLTNRSGASYRDVQLQLVAGTLNRVQPQRAYEQRHAKAVMAMASVADMAQEALLDYHLYRVERPTTLLENQTKQLALLSASGISVTRQYLLNGHDGYYRGPMAPEGQKLKPSIYVKFQNKGGQLGKPLPAGVIRVYARDSKGAAQFVGEDRINHTAKNEEIALKLGEAFDITAERKQTDFKWLHGKGERNIGAEVAYRFEIRNAKDEAVTVRVQEALSGDWEMISESHRHSKVSSHMASWDVPIPADGKTTLEYRLRVRW